MTVPLEAAGPPADGSVARTHAYRGGVLVAVLVVVGAAVLLPVAAVSVVHVLQRPVGGRAYTLMQPTDLRGEWTKLNVAAVSMNEAAETMTLRVSGFHDCAAVCPEVERVQLFSIHANPNGALGSPPSATLELPRESGEVDQQITLPFEGNLVDYPFDRYRLLLGIALSRVTAAGVEVPFRPDAARAALAFSVVDAIPRATMAAPKLADPRLYGGRRVVYASVAALGFSRPAYLQILAVDLTLLVVISAIYAVIFRPFEQIIPTVGGVILGVWGVRALLVGSYPPDSTGVDLVLEAAVFLVLLIVGVRSALFMWPRTHFGAGRAERPRP